MEGRRVRRFGRRHPHSRNQTILPISSSAASNLPSNLSSTFSCWYCDYKISTFNEPLYRFGRKHARFLKVWFSVGVGFSLTALFAVIMILLWELATALRIFKGNSELSNLSSAMLVGLAPSESGITISVPDAIQMLVSTLVSVTVHEIGHALAAASFLINKKQYLKRRERASAIAPFSMDSSEGLQMEYIAIFIAILFPGALVAFNNETLQALPRFTLLRVYCAGVWHNAVFCAVCGLILLVLPLILFPFYIHGESLMVLAVPSVSPLSGYLIPGDVITSLDGMPIRSVQDWMQMTALVGKRGFGSSNNSEAYNSQKAYCVPSFMLMESNAYQPFDDQSVCSDDLTAFVSIPCSNSSALADGVMEDGNPNRKGARYCLSAKDVVKLKKCADGRVKAEMNGTTCMCLEDETCLAPVQIPGVDWVEVTYFNPSSPECLAFKRNKFPMFESSNNKEFNCGGTFVFVGDAVSMAHSVRFSAYRPRWGSAFAVYFPHVLEKIIMFTFHVSLTLALLNSLPVYFLDGESILEVTLCYLSLLSSRKRDKLLNLCLLGGTCITIFTFLRIFNIFLSQR